MPRKLTTEEFIQKAKLKHGNTYDYSLAEYINTKHKLTLICYQHGCFDQTPNDHLNGNGCPLCGRNKTESVRRRTISYFVDNAHKVHNNRYNYDSVIYISGRKNVTITCELHGNFRQTPNNHLRGTGCPTCADRNYNCVYIWQAGKSEGVWKIGICKYNKVNTRIRNVASAHNYVPDCVYYICTDNARAIEQHILNTYTKRPTGLQPVNGYTEFRILSEHDVNNIKQYINTHSDK